MTAQAQGIPKKREIGRNGLLSWIMTVDHKKIGILYIYSAFIFFLVGGLEALLMRLQLAKPENTFLSADTYNQVFTMHGTTMIFLVVMPLAAGFGNYLVPLMIGARDMAFPKLNALSYWTYLFGGVFMYSSFIFGGAPNDGWFSYAPLTEKMFSPTHGMDYWVMGILLLGLRLDQLYRNHHPVARPRHGADQNAAFRLDDLRDLLPGGLFTALADYRRAASAA